MLSASGEPANRKDADRLYIALLTMLYAVYGAGLLIIAYNSLLTGNKVSKVLPVYGAGFAVVPLAALGAGRLVRRAQVRWFPDRAGEFFEPLLALNTAYVVLAASLLFLINTYDITLALLLAAGFPAANLVLIAFLSRMRGDAQGGQARLRAVLAGVNLGMLIVCLGAITVQGAWGRVIAGALNEQGQLTLFQWYAAGLILALSLVALPISFPHILTAMPVAGLLVSLLFLKEHSPVVAWLVACAAAGVLATWFLDGPGRRLSDTQARLAIDIGAIVWIVALCISLDFAQDRHHYAAYLGAVNDVIHGKNLLVDAYSQYGIVCIYTLSLIFGSGIIPLTFSGFSLVLSILLAAQFGLVYFLLRSTVKNTWLSLLVTTLAIGLNFYVERYTPVMLPSPTRFIDFYVLLAVIALRTRSTRHRTLWLWIEHIVFAASILWSLENLVRNAAVYAAIRSFEALAANRPWRETFRDAARRLAAIGGVIVVTYLGWTLLTWVRSGQWPVWQIHFETLRYYASQALVYAIPIDVWGVWVFMPAIYAASLIVLLVMVFFGPDRSKLGRHAIVLGMTMGGAAQFAQWMSNSHVISVYVIPAAFVAAYWFDTLKDVDLPAAFVRPARAALCAVAAYCVLTIAQSPYLTRRVTPLSWAITQVTTTASSRPEEFNTTIASAWDRPPGYYFAFQSNYGWKGGANTDPLVPEALALINKYAPDDPRVAVLIRPDSEVDALLRAGKSNVFPMSDPAIDEFSPTAKQRAAAYVDQLQPGTILIVQTDMRYRYRIQDVILQRLCSRFGLEALESSPSGIVAARLHPLGEDYTCGGSVIVGVLPLPDTDPARSITRPDGTTPCGIAKIDWGKQVFDLNDFPVCAEHPRRLTVECLDEASQWSAEHVSNVQLEEYGFTFDVQQEGVCGLFLAPKK